MSGPESKSEFGMDVAVEALRQTVVSHVADDDATAAQIQQYVHAAWRIGTYILASEPGTSLMAAGWRLVASVKGRQWDTPSRPRVARGTEQDKLRFEAGLSIRQVGE